MGETELLAEQFEANRGHLRSVAQRLLGSSSDADDAVQEAWFRLARSDVSGVDSLKAWLTTVVARVCLDMLRTRKTRREESLVEAETVAAPGDAGRALELADSIGLAMLAVLQTLAPVERVAFVLHDMFALPFSEIAPIVGRTPAAARQLASRARRRIQGSPPVADGARDQQRALVDAFLAASQSGDFAALLAVLDPDVVLRADAGAVAASVARMGDTPPLEPEMRGRDVVADIFRGRARAARPALLDGEPGLIIAVGGQARMAFDFVIADGRIVEISLVAEPAALRARDIAM